MVSIDSHTEEFKAMHRAALVKTLEDLGGIIEADIKDSIDVAWPPASSPNNPPHRRLGLLQIGTGYQTDEGVLASGVRTTIYSSRPIGDPLVPVYLEFGTRGRRVFTHRGGQRVEDKAERGLGMEPRPFMTPARDRWEGQLAGELIYGIRGNLGFSGGAAGSIEISRPPLLPADMAMAGV